VAYVTNASGQLNVWKQPVHLGSNGRPSMPLQLTALVENSTRRAIWSPDGKRILTNADRHGTENYQLYEVPSDHGWLYPLTDNPQVRYELGSDPFSPDGRYIVYATNERDLKDLDIVLQDMETGETKTLLAGDAAYFPGEWSSDGNHLIAFKVNNNVDQEIFLINVETGESKNLTPHEDDVKFIPGKWHPDGSGFYFVTDQGRENLGLAFFDIQANNFQWVQTPDWDIQGMTISKDGRFLAWLVNEDGFSRLYLQKGGDDEAQQFLQLPAGVYSSLQFSPTEPILGFYINRSVGPAELYMLNVETGEHWILTQGFLGGVPIEEMVEPELIRYATHDGRQIPAFLYKPKGLAKGERASVVVSIHGGPEAQELPTYNNNGFYQYLLSQGIGILAPNVRGSTGYGKTYQKLIHRDWGGDELKDFDYAVRYLHSLDWVAPDHIGVFGGSFGGFATLSCVTRLSHYWAAAVDIFGPSNLVTFTKAVPPFWKRFMKKWVGDPEEDYEMLMERSPISYVKNVEAPLMVIQGANDPRVVKGESDQMVAQLNELGREVEYMVFEDEGHGFTKTSNWLKALRATADWFEKYL